MCAGDVVQLAQVRNPGSFLSAIYKLLWVVQRQEDQKFKTILGLHSEFKANFSYMTDAVRKKKKESGINTNRPPGIGG